MLIQILRGYRYTIRMQNKYSLPDARRGGVRVAVLRGGHLRGQPRPAAVQPGPAHRRGGGALPQLPRLRWVPPLHWKHFRLLF